LSDGTSLLAAEPGERHSFADAFTRSFLVPDEEAVTNPLSAIHPMPAAMMQTLVSHSSRHDTVRDS